MTTFVDFRYARSLGPSLFFAQREEETELVFDGERGTHLALEIQAGAAPGRLAGLRGSDGEERARLMLEAPDSLAWLLPDGTRVLVAHWEGSRECGSDGNRIALLRIGPERLGLRLGAQTREARTPAALREGALELVLGEGVRVLGRGTGRAERWGELAYRRTEPGGLALDVVFDWHHLRAGVPLAGTLLTESLIERSPFRLGFHSYVLDDESARETDFARLFASQATPEVTLDFSPILYARANPETVNVGAYVCESERLCPGLRARCERADLLVAPSRFVAHALRGSGLDQPLELIPLGVDTDFFRPPATRQPFPGGRGFNFFAACTSVSRKNVRPLVRAFLQEFRESEDVALFLFVRPEYHTTQNLVEQEFGDWEGRYFRDSAPILFSTEYLEREVLRDLYAHADAYVMPSSEGFGLTLLEAMSCGTPTIGLAYGGVTDFLDQDNGYLVPSGRTVRSRDVSALQYLGQSYVEPDVRGLRAVMRHVFENREEARRRGERARRDCEQRFDWGPIGDRFCETLERAAGLERRPRRKRSADRPQLALALCVPDDVKLGDSLERTVLPRGQCSERLAFYTRFARSRDVIRTRDAGFLLFTWDGSFENVSSLLSRLPGRPWVLVMLPGEELEGDLTRLRSELGALPADVGELCLAGPGGEPEPRLVRGLPNGVVCCRKTSEAVRVVSRRREPLPFFS